MTARRIPFLLAFLLASTLAVAQSNRSTDFGCIVGSSLSTGIGRQMSLEVEEELRFDNDCSQLDRWLNSVGMDYAFPRKHLHVGMNVDYIRRYNDKGYFENRGRLGADVTYNQHYRRFKFSLRSRVLSTFMDENTGDHRVNPKTYWRNRLQISYQKPNSPFKYSISSEAHWLVNDPKHNVVDDIRTVASVDYRITRISTVSAFVRLDHEIQVKNPVDKYYLGATYKLKL